MLWYAFSNLTYIRIIFGTGCKRKLSCSHELYVCDSPKIPYLYMLCHTIYRHTSWYFHELSPRVQSMRFFVGKICDKLDKWHDEAAEDKLHEAGLQPLMLQKCWLHVEVKYDCVVASKRKVTYYTTVNTVEDRIL